MESNDRHRAVGQHQYSFVFRAYIPCSDRVADAIRKNLGLSAADLSLAKVLESGTWKGGREIAKQKRPQTGGPPIDIESDGTVF
jgi:hypothetical protein